MRRRLWSLSFLSLAFLATFTLVSPVGATSGIGGRPALPREDEPRSQSIFIHTIKPGETISDKVVVGNQSDRDQTIIIYAVDAIPSSTGSITCKQRVEATTDAGSWITLATNELTLPAGKSEIVDFNITAPAGADVGEHNACLAFETKEDEGEVSGNLRIRTRSAVRVALTIPGKLHRQLAITGFQVDQENYHQRYTLSLQNKGNVSADTKIEATLRTVFGGTVYTNSGEYPILAGKAFEITYENDKSPFFGGWYFAQATAAYDKNANTWGTNRTEHLTKLYADTQLIFIWPQPFGMVLILLLLGGLVWLIVWLVQQERIRLDIIHSWQAHTVKDDETILSLAKGRGVDWKRVAKINKLKPPYLLEVGDTIYLPKKKSVSKRTRLTKER